MNFRKALHILFSLLLFVAFSCVTPENNYVDQNTIVASHIFGTATFNKNSTSGKVLAGNVQYISTLISNSLESRLKLNGATLEAYLHLGSNKLFFITTVNYLHSGISPPVNC